MKGIDTLHPTSQEQARAAVGMVMAVGEAIQSLGEVPSGELYARLMGNLNFTQYNQIIEILVGAKLISNHAHLLKWIGPAKLGSVSA